VARVAACLAGFEAALKQRLRAAPVLHHDETPARVSGDDSDRLLYIYTARAGKIELLRGDLHGRWRQAARAVMVLLSARGLPPAQIAELVDCHPATVRRWIARFNAEGQPGWLTGPGR
jgi:DNA-directed RNA polymerase specialized sigma24 family protein